MTTSKKIEALKNLVEGNNLNPTIIYNEGWMIRLLVIESMINGITIDSIDFGTLAKKKWSSEALISSPFVGANENPEGYTHADIILGDFDVKYEDSGEIQLNDSPKILGIIEAKMGSNLSQKTSNARNYNQASRNICCLSHITKNNPNCNIFFIVAAPKSTIDKHKIEEQVTKEKVSEQIKQRFHHSLKDNEYFPEVIERCKISVISYEKWIEAFECNPIKSELKEFYDKCLIYNKIKK
jgi:hypothetical protein